MISILPSTQETLFNSLIIIYGAQGFVTPSVKLKLIVFSTMRKVLIMKFIRAFVRSNLIVRPPPKSVTKGGTIPAVMKAAAGLASRPAKFANQQIISVNGVVEVVVANEFRIELLLKNWIYRNELLLKGFAQTYCRPHLQETLVVTELLRN